MFLADEKLADKELADKNLADKELANKKLKDIYNSDFYLEIDSNSLNSAAAIVPLLQNIFAATSVQDFGAGTGAWLAEFLKHGAKTVLGYDANRLVPALLHLPVKNMLQGCDFTALSFKPKMCSQLAISLEVAEHLPETSAAHFVQVLTQAAPCVVFSAALPGQGGTEHLNEQHPAYWQKLFAERGYVAFDPVRPLIYNNPNVCWWYRQNLFAFVQLAYLQAHPALFAALVPFAVNDNPENVGFVSEWNLYQLCEFKDRLDEVMQLLHKAHPQTTVAEVLRKIE